MFETPLSLFKITENAIYDKIRASATDGKFYQIITIKSNEKTANYLKNKLEENGFRVNLALNFVLQDNHRLHISWSL